MFFDLPQVLEVFLKDGPLRQVLDSATDLVRDARRSAIHIVTTPEPLAVSETIQLYRGLRERQDLHLGCLFVNRIPKRWLDAEEWRVVREELEGPSVGESWEADLALADYFARRSETADKCIQGLRHDIDLPTLAVEASLAEGAAIIDELAERLSAEVPW